MTSSPIRRWLSLAVTGMVFTALLGYLALRGPAEDSAGKDAGKGGTAGRGWPMFGGTLSRNLVNLVEKDMPTTWSIKQGAEKNIKWSIPLGSKAYGGPVVSAGK